MLPLPLNPFLMSGPQIKNTLISKVHLIRGYKGPSIEKGPNTSLWAYYLELFLTEMIRDAFQQAKQIKNKPSPTSD